MLEDKYKDHLTGFYQRGSLNPFLEKLLLSTESKNGTFSIALIDLDHLKKYNDKFGHSFGDLILKYVAGTLRLSLQQEDFYGFRYGGDEFVMIFPDKGSDQVSKLLRRCTHNLATRPFLFNNKLFKITFSCGIASFPYGGKEVWQLLEKADRAMYFSKRHGRNFITQASKLAHLQLYNVVALLTSVCIILFSAFALYTQLFVPHIQSVKKKIKSIKFTTRTKGLDVLVLKDGTVFKGHILKETEDKVIFGLDLEEGEGNLIFDKSEIEEIKHRAKPVSPDIK